MAPKTRGGISRRRTRGGKAQTTDVPSQETPEIEATQVTALNVATHPSHNMVTMLKGMQENIGVIKCRILSMKHYKKAALKVTPIEQQLPLSQARKEMSNTPPSGGTPRGSSRLEGY